MNQWVIERETKRPKNYGINFIKYYYVMNIIAVDNVFMDRQFGKNEIISLQLLENLNSWDEYLDLLDKQIAQEKIYIQAKLLELEPMIWKKR